jgi:hypothetical protein
LTQKHHRQPATSVNQPPGPCTKRPAISHSTDPAEPPITEPSRKVAMAARNSGLRPMTSPSRPWAGMTIVAARR